MYNVNLVADERNFRIIFLRSLLSGEVPGVEKRRHYKVYLEEYDKNALLVDRVMRWGVVLHLGFEVSLRLKEAICLTLRWGWKIFSENFLEWRANELLVKGSSLPL